jgi:hypothetical protein
MSFAPTSSGRLPHVIHPITPHASVSHENWRKAQQLAQTYLASIRASNEFGPEFQICVEALQTHIDIASAQINRLA